MLICDNIRHPASGEVQLGYMDPETGAFQVLYGRANLFMKTGADLLARLLAGGQNLQVRGMYLEFDNGVDPIVEPAYDRDSDISYYTASLGADRDFLHVPLVSQPMLSASDGTYSTNQVSFFSLSSSKLGENGEQTFQTGSRVYGGALVATPDLSDRSKDIVVCRTYWGASALEKDASHQVAVRWVLTFA
jgi:hypothetical protein